MLKSSKGGCLPKNEQFHQVVAKLPLAKNPISVVLPSKDAESRNTAVEVYFQVGMDDIVDRVIIDLLSHLMNEPLYNQLRTKEQVSGKLRQNIFSVTALFHASLTVFCNSSSGTVFIAHPGKMIQNEGRDICRTFLTLALIQLFPNKMVSWGNGNKVFSYNSCQERGKSFTCFFTGDVLFCRFFCVPIYPSMSN